MEKPEEPGPVGPVASISGRIVDADGKPCPRAAAVAFEEGPRQFTGLRMIGLCRAGEDGRFRLEVTPGPCLVVPMAPGVFNFHPEGVEVSHGTRLDPKEGPWSEDVELRLPMSLGHIGRIVVEVRDPAGNPVPGAWVSLCSPSPSEGDSESKKTDERGRTNFDDILPGSRSLVVPGNRRYEPERRSLDLAKGETLKCALKLRGRSKPGNLSVLLRCEDEGGEGIEGVKVDLHGGDDFWEEVFTGPGGESLVTGLPGNLAVGHFYATAWHKGHDHASASFQHPFAPWPTAITLRLVSRQDPPDQPHFPLARRPGGSLPPSPGAALSGTVRDATGAPVANASVRWIRDDGQALPDEYSPLIHEVATTDRQGRFCVLGLPPGPAILMADSPPLSWMGNPGPTIPKVRVVLVEGKNDDVELRIPMAASELAEVACRVVDENGNPRVGVTVTGDRCVAFVFSTEGSSETDSDGVTTLRVLPGTNDLHCWGTETHDGMHQVVEAVPGGRHAVEFRMSARKGERSLSLQVTVLDEVGEPVPGAKVHLSNGDGDVGEGTADDRGLCLFPRLHDSLRAQELHAYAFATGFCISGEGCFIATWPEKGPADAVVTLQRSVKVRIRVAEEGTDGWIPGCRVYREEEGGCTGSQEYSEWEAERGAEWDVRPGRVKFAANAPGYSLARVELVVRQGEPTALVDLRLKRLDP